MKLILNPVDSQYPIEYDVSDEIQQAFLEWEREQENSELVRALMDSPWERMQRAG